MNGAGRKPAGKEHDARYRVVPPQNLIRATSLVVSILGDSLHPCRRRQAERQRPFEHEARLKELLARQAEINEALDLDKSDARAIKSEAEPDTGTAALPCRTESFLPVVQPNSLPAPTP